MLRPSSQLILTVSAVMAFFASVVFYFMPFQGVFELFGASKQTVFLSLLGISAVAAIWVTVLDGAVTPQELNTLLLYLPLAVYIGIIATTTKVYMGDTMPLMVLSFINPVFVFLAMRAIPRKRVIVTLLYICGLIYVVLAGLAFQKTLGNNVVDLRQAFADYFTHETWEEARITHQNISEFLAYTILIGTAYISFKRPVSSLALIAVSLLAFFLMLAAGGRTATVAALLVVISFGLHLVGRFDKKLMMLMAAGFVGLVAMLATVDSSVYIKMLEQSDFVGAKRFLSLFDSDDQTMRGEFFANAWELWLLNTKNMIIGSGMNYFPVYGNYYDLGAYPHNIFLELLAEYGVVGLVAFCLPVIYILYWRHREFGNFYGNSALENAIFAIFLFKFIDMNYTGGLRECWTFVFFTMLLLPRIENTKAGKGLVFNTSRKRKRRKGKGRSKSRSKSVEQVPQTAAAVSGSTS